MTRKKEIFRSKPWCNCYSPNVPTVSIIAMLSFISKTSEVTTKLPQRYQKEISHDGWWGAESQNPARMFIKVLWIDIYTGIQRGL